MISGQIANLTFSAGTGGTATSGSYAVTVVDANNFTIVDSVSGSITGTPSVTRNNYIRASGNVTSITDSAVGIYIVNFTTAMSDANYAVSGMVDQLPSGYTLFSANLAVGSVTIYVIAEGLATASDPSTVSVVIHR
jgi:hypothetical protein